MKIVNISSKKLVFVGLLGGKDLILKPKDISESIIPTNLLITSLAKRSLNIRLVTESNLELKMLNRLVPASFEEFKTIEDLILRKTEPDSPILNEGYTPFTFVVAGGTPTYTFSVEKGVLPTGISLNSATGVLSGTATQVGEFEITIKVTDSNEDTDELRFTWVIEEEESSL